MLTLCREDRIADCLNLANSDFESAQTNPESYVFFIAHMYHMLGAEDGNQPWSIHRNWDFELMMMGEKRIYGAIDL